MLNEISRPFDLILVCGHGRSYGHRNRVLGWSLPGIIEAEWSYRWLQPDDARHYAVVTDIGNDLMYDSGPSQLFDWVRIAIDQLTLNRRFDTSRMIITGLPIERARAIGALQFKIFQKIFFPKSRSSLIQILDHATHLNGLLNEHAQRIQSAWFTPPMRWYGVDPIHIRKRLMDEAWRAILGPIIEAESVYRNEPSRGIEQGLSRGGNPSADMGLRRRLRLVFSRAKQQSWFGLERGTLQPLMQFEDGSTVSFY